MFLEFMVVRSLDKFKFLFFLFVKYFLNQFRSLHQFLLVNFIAHLILNKKAIILNFFINQYFMIHQHSNFHSIYFILADSYKKLLIF